jgi:hypothetical protein
MRCFHTAFNLHAQLLTHVCGHSYETSCTGYLFSVSVYW